MAEVIQFNCPACGTTLRVPLLSAGQQGPCPWCGTHLCSPDPERGTAASTIDPSREATSKREKRISLPEPPPAVSHSDEIPRDPKKPTAEISPPVGKPTEPVLPRRRKTKPDPAEAVGEAAPTERESAAMLGLLTGLIGVVLGFLGGMKYVDLTKVVSPVQTSGAAAVGESPETRAPIPPASPMSRWGAGYEPPSPSVKTERAEAALRAFLTSPDWTTRSANVLNQDQVRPLMESYSMADNDGPTPFTSISLKLSRISKTPNSDAFVFLVMTDDHPAGIPVPVVETPSGSKVNWSAFIELKDRKFEKFSQEPEDSEGTFHLFVTAQRLERAAVSDNQFYASFMIQAPSDAKPRIAFVLRSAPGYPVLKNRTANRRVFAPVLDVVKRKTPEGQDYLEVVNIRKNDWFPEVNNSPQNPAAQTNS